MWDERCSANFMLPEQLSPKSSCRSASGCPLCRRRDFCYFQSTWLAQHAVRQPGALRCFLTPLLVGPGPCAPSRSRPAYYFTEARQWPLSDGCFFFFPRHFGGTDESGSVTLLRPSPSKSADIAVRHRVEPQATWLRQQSAQQHRALVGPPVKH